MTIQIRSIEHLHTLTAAVAPFKLVCELRLAGGRTSHLKSFWLSGARRTILVTRTNLGHTKPVVQTNLIAFIERGQLHTRGTKPKEQ